MSCTKLGGGLVKKRAGSGMKKLKFDSSVIAFVIAIIMLSGFAGCYAIANLKLPDLTPSLQAMSYDIKNLNENRIAFTFSNNTFTTIRKPPKHPGIPASADVGNPPALPEDFPESWDIRDSVYTELTGDDRSEFALIVWRPWRDLPIMKYSKTPSLIKDFHDKDGESCHLAIIDPDPDRDRGNKSRSYREVWVASAMPVPLLRIEAGDVDGDDVNELVALEGSYESSREGPGTRISVWRWNGFGFFIDWRSEPSRYEDLALEDINGDGIADIIAW